MHLVYEDNSRSVIHELPACLGLIYITSVFSVYVNSRSVNNDLVKPKYLSLLTCFVRLVWDNGFRDLKNKQKKDELSQVHKPTINFSAFTYKTDDDNDESMTNR